MDKQKLYLIIAILTVITIFFSLIVFLLQRKQNAPSPTEPVDINLPTPTTVEVRVTTPPTVAPTFTGALDEELPKEERDLVEQKQALKTRLPLTEANFTITFDYGEDKFIVELAEPKAESQVKFNDWLQANYPAIPIDRFIIK